MMKKARRIRKLFGGGMRQAGYLAAAGLFALQHNIPLLKDDLRRAQTIAKSLSQKSFIDSILPVESNILIFTLNKDFPSDNFLHILQQNNILALPFGSQTIRFVTHLDFNDEMLEVVVNVLKAI